MSQSTIEGLQGLDLSGDVFNNGTSLSHEAMLKGIATIVEQERQQSNKGADKMTIDVAKAEAVKKELENEILTFHVIENRLEKSLNKEEVAWLFQLQNLYDEKIPNLAEGYITRFVFDLHHTNIAMVKNCKVVGGITYRHFVNLGFMEIAFLAVSSGNQVKGYGAYLMNYYKEHAVRQGCLLLLTYGDATALGYFKKQGFSEDPNLPEKIYKCIKHYTKSTLVTCRLEPEVPYANFSHYIRTVRDFNQALAPLRSEEPKRHFEGLGDAFKKSGGKPLLFKDIPGLENQREAEGVEEQAELDKKINNFLEELKKHDAAWPFLAAVHPDDAEGYYDVIEYPMDLQKMTKRAKEKYYTHSRLFLADLKRMFYNCFLYNSDPRNEFYKIGYELNVFALTLQKKHFPQALVIPHLPKKKPQK